MCQRRQCRREDGEATVVRPVALVCEKYLEAAWKREEKAARKKMPIVQRHKALDLFGT
jgi:hypothetical protein